MNISDPRRPWIPAIATDIRRTFQQVDAADDWRCRQEGALEVMRKLSAQPPRATVTRLPARERL